MKLKLLFLSTAFVLGACVPSSKKSPDVKAPALTVKGSLSFAETSGPTDIYVEDSPIPFAESDGSNFSLELSNEQIETLRHERGGSNAPLRLYFISEEGERQVAVNSTLRYTDRGSVDLGIISMLPEITLSGNVEAISPIDNQLGSVEGVLVQVGRYTTRTNASGEFEIRAPQNSNLPLLLECEEYVRSVGTWQSGSANVARTLRLYKNLEPVGQLEVNAISRSSLSTVDLMVSGNAMSRFVRISANAEDLTGDESAAAPWMSFDEGLKLPAEYFERPVIYYQFADESRSAIGPVLSFNPPTAE